MRSRNSSTSSLEDTSPRSMASAWAARPAKARSVIERAGYATAPCQAAGVQLEALTGRLVAMAGRGAGTDAERRAALALAGELEERGHPAWVETLWLRPAWATALALGALLGAAASLVSVAVPLAGVVAGARRAAAARGPACLARGLRGAGVRGVRGAAGRRGGAVARSRAARPHRG